MQLLKDRIKQVMAQKKLGNQVIGLVTLNEVKRFLGDENITGYVKFDKLFLKIQDQPQKIKIFQQKKTLLENINNALSRLGYDTDINGIFFK